MVEALLYNFHCKKLGQNRSAVVRAVWPNCQFCSRAETHGSLRGNRKGKGYPQWPFSPEEIATLTAGDLVAAAGISPAA